MRDRIQFWESAYLTKLRRGASEDESRASADSALIARDEREAPTRTGTIDDLFNACGWASWFCISEEEASALKAIWALLAGHRRSARLAGKRECECVDCEKGLAEHRVRVDRCDEVYKREAEARAEQRREKKHRRDRRREAN